MFSIRCYVALLRTRLLPCFHGINTINLMPQIFEITANENALYKRYELEWVVAYIHELDTFFLVIPTQEINQIIIRLSVGGMANKTWKYLQTLEASIWSWSNFNKHTESIAKAIPHRSQKIQICNQYFTASFHKGQLAITHHHNIVEAFWGMHVSPPTHSYAWLPRKCDYRTDRHTDRQKTPNIVIHMCR